MKLSVYPTPNTDYQELTKNYPAPYPAPEPTPHPAPGREKRRVKSA